MTKNPNATDVHVGKRMRMRRLMLQMSQEVFAARLGVTFQQVQKYEKGVNRVSASRLQQACNVLQVPVQFFFDGLPKTETGARRREDTSYALISNLLSSAEGIALAKGFMQIEDRAVRRHIVKLVTQIGASGGRKSERASSKREPRRTSAANK
jgi:transcriptional regulator with XRE-family HTH domain